MESKKDMIGTIAITINTILFLYKNLVVGWSETWWLLIFGTAIYTVVSPIVTNIDIIMAKLNKKSIVLFRIPTKTGRDPIKISLYRIALALNIFVFVFFLWLIITVTKFNLFFSLFSPCLFAAFNIYVLKTVRQRSGLLVL